MSIWGIGVVLGPTLGPVIGGWLTDNYSWRWVFYINVPFGILAVLGVLAYFPDTKHEKKSFDFFGFGVLSIAVGVLQIFLDRGPIKGWFESGEIKIEAAVAALAFYLFFAHTLTAKRPFIRLSLYKDRNFASGNVLMFVVGIVLFANLALISPMLQGLMNYSVLQAGLVMAPRGAGTLIAMFLVGRMVGKFDARAIIALGLGLTAYSLWSMSHFSLLMNMHPIISTGLIQGLGTGIAYVPLAALGFATLPSNMRNEGTALFNLVRNIGSSIGISTVQGLLVHNTQVLHSDMTAHLTPRMMTGHAMGHFNALQAAAALNDQVTAQSAFIAYLDDFHLMLLLTLASTLTLFFVRKPQPSKSDHVVLE
jgi:DHA2 family multidrug resistance protein